MHNPIFVNQTGRVTKGDHVGTVGNVVGADWIRQTVQIKNIEGHTLTVPWSAVEQFRD